MTGEKTINPAAMVPLEKPTDFCPHPGGARSIGATAYDPQVKLLFIPLQEHCTEMTAFAKDPGEKTADSKFVLKLRPGSDGLVGRLDAIDLEHRKVAWSHRERAPQSTAALPTAGGVVFQGAFDRTFKAFDAQTGKVLWSTRLSDIPNSYPVSFLAHGKQYVAVVSGSGSPYTATWMNLLPELRAPPREGATLWVFELPEP
jgi:alcohol dehydrogenase (cytochrome c)